MSGGVGGRGVGGGGGLGGGWLGGGGRCRLISCIITF